MASQNAWMKYTCTRAQLALNAVYTDYAWYRLVMITYYSESLFTLTVLRCCGMN